MLKKLAPALVAADLEFPFGPSFFLGHLGRFVRDQCPAPTEDLPIVPGPPVHLRDVERVSHHRRLAVLGRACRSRCRQPRRQDGHRHRAVPSHSARQHSQGPGRQRVHRLQRNPCARDPRGRDALTGGTIPTPRPAVARPDRAALTDAHVPRRQVRPLDSSKKRADWPRRGARSRCCSTVSRASSQSLQRTANGSARSRASAISWPHSTQWP